VESEQGVLKTSTESSYHGREGWLLRWLLKKLQSPKGNEPRYVNAAGPVDE
jgi:nucleolar pre-ribosomal-associated protein 2